MVRIRLGVIATVGVAKLLRSHDHGRGSWGGGVRGCIPPTTEAGGWPVQSPPPSYKGDEQMKSILHNTQINTPEEVVSYIDDEIIFSMKFE